MNSLGRGVALALLLLGSVNCSGNSTPAAGTDAGQSSGTGGSQSTGGSQGTGGSQATGGSQGTGGSQVSGSGGQTASGGKTGQAGQAGNAGQGGAAPAGTGGATSTGGVGGTAPRTGGSSGSGGANAAGGQAGQAVTGSGGAGGSIPLPATLSLHVAGDSTAAIFPATDATMRVGWAAVLQQFFATTVTVNDAAKSGRSSKSFIDEGFWPALKTMIHQGDYVFIQFAHNDEKTDDAARYTDPATTFRTYLKTYIADTRAAGGVPVLLTPISRRKFSGTTVNDTHGAYPAAVVAVGTETSTPVIDMTTKTKTWLQGLGPDQSVEYFATGDDTHLSAKGAKEVAGLVVQGIRELNLPLAQRLVP